MNGAVRALALLALCALPAAAAAVAAPDTFAQGLLAASLPRAALWLSISPALRAQGLAALGNWPDAAALLAQCGPGQAYNLGNALALSGDFEAAIAAYDRALLAEPGEEDASFNRALLVEALYRRRLAAAGPGAGAANAAASLRSKGRLDRMSASDSPSGTGDGMAAGRESPSLDGAPGSGSAAGQGAGRDSQESGDGKAHGAASDAGGAGRKGGGADSPAEAFRQVQRKSTRSLEAQWVTPTPVWLAAIPDDPRQYLKLRLLAEKKHRLRASVGADGAAQ